MLSRGPNVDSSSFTTNNPPLEQNGSTLMVGAMINHPDNCVDDDTMIGRSNSQDYDTPHEWDPLNCSPISSKLTVEEHYAHNYQQALHRARNSLHIYSSKVAHNPHKIHTFQNRFDVFTEGTLFEGDENCDTHNHNKEYNICESFEGGHKRKLLDQQYSNRGEQVESFELMDDNAGNNEKYDIFEEYENNTNDLCAPRVRRLSPLSTTSDSPWSSQSPASPVFSPLMSHARQLFVNKKRKRSFCDVPVRKQLFQSQ